MAADIDEISLVADGPGDTPEFIQGFEDNRNDVGMLKQFPGGSEAGRTGADDEGGAR